MDKALVFQVNSEISKVTSMSNRSLRLQVDTEENLSDATIAQVFNYFEKRGHFVFAIEMIKPEDLLNLPEFKPDFKDEKSPAKRLKDVIYIWFEQSGKKGDFELFYRTKMDKFIEAVKNKLE